MFPRELSGGRDRRLALLAVFALGCSCAVTQLALLRELMAAFEGNEMVLGVALGLWLLLMGLGASLGRRWSKSPEPTPLAVASLAVAVLPVLQVFALRTLRNVVFVRGASVGLEATAGASLVVLLPYCLAAGCGLTLGCALLARTAGTGGVGQGYVADSVGGILGALGFSLVLVQWFTPLTALVWPGALNLAVAAALGWHGGRRNLAWAAAVLAASLIAVPAARLDRLATRLQYTGQTVVASADSPYGRLVITESSGQLNFIENAQPLTSSRDDQHVEEAVHYALAQRPKARAVLLLSGGISGTARELLKYPVERVDYVELDPLVLELGRRYLPASLADPRIHTYATDGRRFVQRFGRAARAAAPYDVVIIDAPDPATAQLNRFYTAEFFAEVKRILAPGGVLSFGLGQYENYVGPELARLLACARRTLGESFRQTVLIPGGRVFFLASDGPLTLDVARRLEENGISTKLVNAHYLTAMLAPDRLDDLARATAAAAPPNTDYSPVLYYYHLRHWLSQFNPRLSLVLPLAALAGLVVYLARSRPAAWVLAASGFAASALELVLLLVFQVLCGSVYQQVGLVVAAFMTGLAAGAWLANGPAVGRLEVRIGRGAAGQPSAVLLSAAAAATAVFAVGLAWLLPSLHRAASGPAARLLLPGAIALLTFLVGGLVGLQFPLAIRLEPTPAAAGWSRLYTADFVGAALGAFLTCGVLLPLLGIRGVCWLVAGLNGLAALAAFGRTQMRTQ